MTLRRSLGPWELLAELGSGGMGTVFRAERADGSVVALKVVHEHVAATPGFLDRFLREGEVGRRVCHENVVVTLATGEDDGRHWIALEYVEGQTLRGLAEELGTVPEELCRHVGREVAKGLAALHAAGLVHRDLKPENVLITRNHVVKVMDLGIARVADDDQRMTQTGTFVGSVQYAAPEQFSGGGKGLDGRADLWALGVTLYELATGLQPFEGADVSATLRNVLHETPRPAGEVNPQLSPFFEEVLRTLLEKDRERRFPSADELRAVFESGEDHPWWRDRARSIRTATRKPLRRIRIPRETALYGRDDEIAKLRSHFDRAAAGDGQVLLIEGEAGIGKSRLVADFVDGLQEQGHDVNFLFGSYPPGGAATASGAFSTAFREHFGDEGSRPFLPETPTLVPAFDALLRGEATPTGELALTKDSLQTCFVRSTQCLAKERTTVVLIDDLHFAPDEGRALFASLAMAVPGHRVLLVGTTRPGIDEAWLGAFSRHPHVTRTSLSRLGAKDLVRLLADSLRSSHLAEDLAGKIAVKSDGNPFFVFEILRGLREGQFLTQKQDGTWVTTRVLADIQIPSTIADVVQARVSDLSDDDRNLLEVAACVGFEFDPAVVAAASGASLVPTLRTFAAVEKSLRLVRSAGRLYRFDHHQVQEHLYAGLHEQLREQLHVAIADAMEARSFAATREPIDLDGPLCVALADHLFRGAAGARAIRYLDAAIACTNSRYDLGASIGLAWRALAERDLVGGRRRWQLVVHLAEKLGIAGRYAEQGDAIAEARRIAGSLGDGGLGARAASLEGTRLTELGLLAEAGSRLEEAVSLAREAGDRQAEGWALGNLANCRERAARMHEALELCDAQLAIVRAIDDRAGEGTAVGNRGHVLSQLGRTAEAREAFEQALALHRQRGATRMEAQVLLNFGNMCLEVGALGDARPRLDDALRLARETGERRAEMATIGALGHLASLERRSDEALTLLRRQEEMAREIGNRHSESVSLGNQGFVLQGLGRFGEACERHERALAIAETLGNAQIALVAEVNLALVACAQGRLADAWTLFTRALVTARSCGARHGEAVALSNLGPLAVSLGDSDEARRRLLECWTVCRESGYRRDGTYATHGLGTVAAAEGDLDEAERRFDEAIAERRELRQEDALAESLTERAEIHRLRGRPELAAACLDEAVRVARRSESAGGELLARCRRGALRAEFVADALGAVSALGTRAAFGELIESRFLLWRMTGDPEHLTDAKRRLDHLVANAPTERQGPMLTNVRLYREIAAAAREAGL